MDKEGSACLPDRFRSGGLPGKERNMWDRGHGRGRRWDDEERRPPRRGYREDEFGERQDFQDEGRYGREDMGYGGRGEGTGFDTQNDPGFYRSRRGTDRDYGYGRYNQPYEAEDEDFGPGYRRTGLDREQGAGQGFRRDYRSDPGELDDDSAGYRPRFGPGRLPFRRRFSGKEGWEMGVRGRPRLEAWMIPGPHTGLGPEGYRRPDECILEDALERLTLHGQVDARRIQVEVKDGEVYLRGQVNSRQAKRLAEDAVETIPGVRDVHNEIRVAFKVAGDMPPGGEGSGPPGEPG